MTPQIISPKGNWLELAVHTIHNGGVVALAYERLFGLAADALNPDAVARSAAIKGRPTNAKGLKPIQVILPNESAIHQVAASVPPAATHLSQIHWPGPVTLLVPAHTHLPLPLLGGSDLIGVRVPGPSPALELARASGKILTATSANRKGGPDPLTSDDLIDLEGVDLIIEGTVPGPPGSTIVDASGDIPKILRQGIVTLSVPENRDHD